MKLETDRVRKTRDWLDGQSSSGKLYAILDAARDPNISRRLHQHDAESVSLYRGEPEEKLASVSPYVVEIDAKPPMTEWILNEGWGESWGMFFFSPASLDELRRHFRRFLLVESPEGKELYFRFYDPRVLRVYLPTCTPFEAKRLFGPVNTYLMESEDGHAFEEFSRKGNRTIKLSDLHRTYVSDWSGAVETPIRTNQRLRIRAEQMKMFSDYMHSSFDKRAAAHLRKEQAARTEAMTDADLYKFVHEGVTRAQNRGFTREADLGLFLEVTLLLGAGFDQRPEWAEETFENPELSSAEKIDRLRQFRDAESDQGLDKDE